MSELGDHLGYFDGDLQAVVAKQHEQMMKSFAREQELREALAESEARVRRFDEGCMCYERAAAIQPAKLARSATYTPMDMIVAMGAVASYGYSGAKNGVIEHGLRKAGRQ